MLNLEQIRARNAMAFASEGRLTGVQGGELIKKVPPLILNHGLLATVAYSYSEREGWVRVFDAIAAHLADPQIGILPENCTKRNEMMDFLTGSRATSETLKLATTEAMAWLTYARRFVKKGD